MDDYLSFMTEELIKTGLKILLNLSGTKLSKRYICSHPF